MSKKMRTGKKAISWIVMIAMMISLFPTAVFGATEDPTASRVQIDGEKSPVYYALDENGNINTEVEPTTDPVVKPVEEKGGATDRVVMSKSIKGTEKENEFDITLTVSTKEELEKMTISPDAAVVLVMDVSGSMDDRFSDRKSRLTVAKEAAESFVNTYAAEDVGTAKRMISIVEYGSDAYTLRGWTDAMQNKSAIVNDIKNLSRNVSYIHDDIVNNIIKRSGYFYCNVDGCNAAARNYSDMLDPAKHTVSKNLGEATNIEGGLMLANNLLSQLENDNSYKDIKNLHVILFTDGVPTYHVSDSNTSSTELQFIEGSEGGRYYAKWADYKDIAGSDGNNLAGQIKGTSNSRAVLNTIAFALGSDQNVGNDSAAEWLKNKVASQDRAYTAQSVSDLTDAFAAINTTIKNLAEAWQITDPLGEYIQYVATSNDGISSSTSDIKHYDQDTHTINWNLKLSKPNSTTGEENKTYTYTTTYRVRLDNLRNDFKPSVKGSEEEADHNYYLTNKATTLTYALKNGSDQYVIGEANFLVPRVEGYVADLTFDKIAHETNAGLNGASFTLTGLGDAEAYQRIAASATTIENEQGVVTFTNIPSGHSYTLKETGTPTGYVENTETYNVTVAYDEAVLKDSNSKKVTKIENKLDPGSKQITITKQWNAPAGTTHPEAEITVLQDEKEFAVDQSMIEGVATARVADGKIIVGGSEDISETITLNVPKIDIETGEEYVYTIKEGTCDGYTQTVGKDTLSIVNTINQASKNIIVEKNWVNPTQSYGGEITIELYKSGDTQAMRTEKLRAGDTQVTFDKLDVYDANGQYITYIVKDKVEGYNEATTVVKEITGGTDSFTVTLNNVIDQQDVSISGEKIWKDAALADTEGNADRPESITVELWANGEKVVDTEAKAENNWKYTFTDLPKYEMIQTDGQTTSVTEIKYTVKEADEKDGKVSYNGHEYNVIYAKNGYDITNQLTDTVDISGTKVWQDNNDEYGVRPDSFTAELYAGETLVDSQVVMDDTFSFKDLPKYDDNGKEIVYTVKDTVPGYESSYVDSVLTNTLMGYDETTSIQVTKLWADNNNVDGLRPESVTINVYADGDTENPVASQEIFGESNEWSYTFTDLPKYRYVEKEAEVPAPSNGGLSSGAGDDSSLTEDEGDQEESLDKETGDIGSKVGDATEGGGMTTDGNMITSEVVAGKAAVTNALGGQPAETPTVERTEIVYTVAEAGVVDDTVVYDGTTYKVTQSGNTITNTITGVKDMYTVNKIWVDQSNAFKTRDAEKAVIHIEKLVDGDYQSVDSWEVPTNGGDQLNHEFAVDRYDENGRVIDYRITEQMGDGTKYSAKIEQDGTTATVTNILDQRDTMVTGEKKWIVPKGFTLPASAELQIYQQIGDGTPAPYGDPIIVSADNNDWTYTVNELPVYEIKNEGTAEATYEKCEYTVQEAGAVDGKITIDGQEYEVSVVGGTVTNTLAQDLIEINVTKNWIAPAGLVRPVAEFTLYQNGTAIQKAETSGTTTENMEVVTFSKLPKYDDNREPYTYTVTETGAPEGYKPATELNLTESYTFANRIDAADVLITGTKHWEGVPEGVALPESIEVALVDVNGNLVEGVECNPYVTDAAREWKYNFVVEGGKYDAETGQYIDYRVVEWTADAQKESVIYDGYEYAVSYGEVTRDENGDLAADITNTFKDYKYQINQHYTVITNGVRGEEVKVSGEPVVGKAGETITVTPEQIEAWKMYDGKEFGFVKNSGNTSVTLEKAGELYTIDLYYERTESSTTPPNPPTPGGGGGEDPYYPPDDPYYPPTNIPDNKTPLAPVPPVVIPETEVPLAPAPAPEEVVIPAEAVPLSDNPKTGAEKQQAAQAGLAALLMMAVAMLIHDLKRKPE